MDSKSSDQVVILNNGYRMPIIGLGMFQTKDGNEINNTISAAIDAGYRHIDTAFTYGNEHLLGRALQKVFHDGKIKREDLFIVSKLPPNGMRPEVVEHFFLTSLKDLQLDYIDLYLIHVPMASKRQADDKDFFPTKDGLYDADNSVDITQTWKEMEKLVNKGYIKSIGISNCNSQQIKRIYDSATIKPAVLQVECHAYFPQFELQDFSKNLEIALTAYSPIGAPYGRTATGNGMRLIDDPRLKPMCEKYSKSPAQILLRYLTQRKIIAIPKSTNPNRLKENINIFDFSLSEEEMAIMKSMGCNRRSFTFTTPKGLANHPEYPFNIPF